MISQDQIAAATIAQIFGSELLNAQKNARTDSGSTPDFVKVHPRDILAGQQPQSHQMQTLEQQRMLQALQREAEASCPLPQQQIPQQAAVSSVQQPISVPQPQTFTGQNPFPQPNLPINNSSLTAPTTSDVWSSIAHSLQRIADRLDTVEITLKKKRVRRK